MTQSEVVSVREYIEKVLAERDKALSLQAEEYRRRLDDLNGEAERLRRMQETYMPREVFEKINQRHCEDIEELKSYRDKQIGRNLTLSSIVSAAIAIAIGLAIKFVGG